MKNEARIRKLLHTFIRDQQRAQRGGIPDPEITSVLTALCEQHGYGNVMATVSELWRKQDSVGAFCYGPCIGVVNLNLSEAKELGLIKDATRKNS